MIKQITFGKGNVTAKKLNVVSAPGVGDVEVSELVSSLWTGEVHLYFSENTVIKIHIHDITSVETRSNDYETDEPWIVLFSRDMNREFSYEYEKILEDILSQLQQ